MNSKVLIILLVLIVIIAIGAFIYFRGLPTNKEPAPAVDITTEGKGLGENGETAKSCSLNESGDIAQEWVRTSAPTYVYDGSGITEESSYALDCASCYRFVYSFESRQAGYGDREGQILAQVITKHNIKVDVKNCGVTSAITDEQFDELNNRLLFSEDDFQKG